MKKTNPRSLSGNVIEIINAHRSRKIESRAIHALISLITKTETQRPIESLSIVAVNDSDIHRINRDFLNHNYPTDVISFDLSDASDQPIQGEIYVNLDRARIQAKEYSVSYSNEVLRLVTHGFLHLLGYDDQTSSQRKHMLDVGEKYLAQLTSK